MPSPKTWDLLGAFVTCLQSVLVANGYYTDIGSYVSREPVQIPDTLAAAVGVALDSMQRVEDSAMRGGRLVNVVIMAKVSTAQTDAQLRLHEVIDDIHRCMFDRRDVFPAGTQYPKFVDLQIVNPAEGMAWIGAHLRFAAHVRLR